jgi:hypothetical protein
METMKPVDQTTFGFPGGNCFSACVATILELPLDEVPYFMSGGMVGGTHHPEWWQYFLAWLAARDYSADYSLLRPGDACPDGLVILSGMSPRAVCNPFGLHSTVGVIDELGCRVVHDPHPSRAGLLSHDDVFKLQRVRR